MRGPAELLATWEAGLAAGPVRRALLLQALAGERSAELAVGARDRLLFELRRALFGERLTGRLACPACGTEQEFDFDVANVLRTPPATGQELEVEAGGWRVRLRLPTSADLLAAAADPPAAKAVLLARCALAVRRDGRPVPDTPPAEVVDLLATAVAEADPAADVRVAMPCVECGQRNTATVDIVSHLWAELDTWARTLLLEVHALARAYGWTEPEVLALSPTRRRHYLELVDHG
ncbi:T4 family baseplate hub assembly chaperone [Saccharothrix coeruleofusca]|uniref:Phage baseplate protein n=1 Tax=Saccharothrix coeruleofusca TaxID=33919 RepID=A0A918EEG0_9PSEU|nr:hypothetical protein [Saccharothrix coeruleofusca]MBP2336531.1 hypothetical protein [Saccharothrix coeruleofusca]GGP52377.1 hypothetical protein GCM10010185_25580 [Saccharothrix coeruleofusca]